MIRPDDPRPSSRPRDGGRLVALLAIAAAGCVHTVEIPPDRLPEVLRLDEGESVLVQADGEDVLVHPDDEPRLVVQRAPRCSAWDEALMREGCAPPLNLPLGHARVDGDHLHLAAYEGSVWWGYPQNEETSLRVDEVHSIALQYDPLERPRFGAGLAVLGPSRAVGIQWQVDPVTWLGLEAGLGAIPDLGAVLWTGVKVRPLRWGNVRPFTGAFLNLSGSVSHVGEDPDPVALNTRELAYGPRLGIDWYLQRRLVLTLEADAFRVEDAGGDLVSRRVGKWLGTGGIAFAYFL